MGPKCNECINYVRHPGAGAYETMCSAPQLIEALDKLGPGHHPQLLIRCNEARAFKAACGTLGRWFAKRSALDSANDS